MNTPANIADGKKIGQLSEDWVTVALGFLIIFILLYLVRLPSPSYGWKDSGDLFDTVLGSANLLALGAQFVFALAAALLAAWLTGRDVRRFLLAFPVLYGVTVAAQVIAGNSAVKGLNLEPVIFSLALGLLLGNVLGLPDWFRATLSAELFVKIGLVLLGTTIIFGDIVEAGALGLIQAAIVVVSVWYFAFWVCRRLKLDDEFSMMLSSAVSICGVSAAIATAGAIQGDGKKLSYVISLVLITAIPMMIAMPYAAKYLELSQEVTGAWLGGTIDTTGAVVASGTMVGERALTISTIVKFSQNVLLGVAAFGISVYWTLNRNTTATASGNTLGVIWERFPKFVLGFIAASLLFSFALDEETVSAAKNSVKTIQTLWFVLAFTAIGLETRFADLTRHQGARPAIAFVVAQLFNIAVTLLIAYLLFG